MAGEAEIIGKIEGRRKAAGTRFGTERTRALLDRLGSPDDALRIIHVAGTDGKGSVCEYVSRCLVENGGDVGTFTSPAVFSYAEQFRVNCLPVGDAALESALSLAWDEASAMDDMPTAFEIETAAALLMFRDAGCGYAVLECGMGGLSDATNAVRRKEAALVTSVSLEHTEYLGSTVEEICAQKAGIIRGCPAFVSVLQTAEGLRFFSDRVPRFSGEGLDVTASGIDGQTFSYRGRGYGIRMLGREQCFDAALAIDCCAHLGVADDAVKRGLASAVVPGRCDVRRSGGRVFVLDGAHNAAAFSPLRQVLGGFDRSDVTVIFGCLSDKNAPGIAEKISGIADRYIVAESQSSRAMDADAMRAALEPRCGGVETARSVRDALDSSGTLVTAVCGSFTILPEACAWLDERR